MARATLDRSKPYGTIYGGSEDGAVFEQDHKRFNDAGDEVVAGASEAGDGDGGGPVVVIEQDDKGNVFRDGVLLDLQAMEVEQLHALAMEAGIKLHPQTGAPKAIEKLLAGLPVKKADGGQLDAQLNG